MLKFEPFGFNLEVHDDTMRLQFNNENPNLKDKVEELIKEDFGKYNIKKNKTRKGFGDSEMYFSIIIFDTQIK